MKIEFLEAITGILKKKPNHTRLLKIVTKTIVIHPLIIGVSMKSLHLQIF